MKIPQMIVAEFRRLTSTLGSWSRRKLWVSARIERMLDALGHPMPRLVYAEHHLSHAAAAFYTSPFEHAAVLTVDGVAGEPERARVDNQDALDPLPQQRREAGEQAAADNDVVVFRCRLAGDGDGG